MGRDLKIGYHKDRKAYEMCNNDCMEDDPIDFQRTTFHNLDLGDNWYFKGTRKDLVIEIQQMLEESSFMAVYNLSMILAYCPADCDYIVFESS